MLKIKNDVDLKELEKFGFTYHNKNEQFYNLDYLENCILIQVKKKIDEEEKTIWTSVDENTYNNIKIGDYYKEAK